MSVPIVRTHRSLDPAFCGRPVALEDGSAVVSMTTTVVMAADDSGLVHGGFLFSLADAAAMYAVNEPTVVLVGATTSFRRPVRVGDELRAEATTVESDGRRHRVEVRVNRGEELVMTASCDCVVTERHVLAETVP